MAVSNLSEETKDKATEFEASAASANDANVADQEPVSSAAQKLQDMTSNVSHKAQDWAANVADKAQETAAAAVDKSNDGIAVLGQRISALGGTVRKATYKNGAIGSAATALADELQAGGQYLAGHGLKDMGGDLTSVLRRYPIPSVLVGFGIGCLLGMTVSMALTRRN
jgi:dsDNA-specific endonuclease/ATPase MutS2